MAALALSPRAAVVLAAVVVAIALVVVLLGARGGGGSGAGSVTVTEAPSSSAVEPGGGGGGAGGGDTDSPTGSAAARPGNAAPSTVVVHVVGAVGRPGVVTVPEGSRVSDALERAGNAGAEADLTRINLARVVVDGERLYVPRVGETEIPAELDPVTGSSGTGGPAGAAAGGTAGAGGAPGRGGTGGAGDAVVDLNSADQATLETLPGIGPSLAGRILAWRDEHGRFTSVEDLLDVNGIGDGRFSDLRDRVRV